jgi:hypothetical protein
VTTQLPERLLSLAGDAPEALPAGDLWQAGRRRHRVRVAAALATVSCLVLATVLLGNGVWRSRQPSPAAPPATSPGQMAVPDRFFHPSPWLPSTRAPGRLVALLGSERGHFPVGEDLTAYVGVSAGSQAYHFLDLPGQAADTDVALSPDGRHLAYWISGGSSAPAVNSQRLAGVAVLDLLTGTSERHDVRTRFGLAPQSLTWVGSGTLAMVSDTFSSLRPNAYAGRTHTYLFTLGSTSGYARLAKADVLDIPVTAWPGHGCAPSCAGLFAQMVDRRVLRVQDATQTLIQTIQLSAPLASVAYVAGPNRVAGVRGNPYGGGATSGPLVIGGVDQRQSGIAYAQLAEVPGGHAYLSVLGWADGSHVVTEQLTPTGELFWVVDVHTGARTSLTTTGYQTTGSRWFSVVLAENALRHPTSAAAIAPPRPWDPRWVAGGALAAVVLAGAVGLGAVRRRRRVRR